MFEGCTLKYQQFVNGTNDSVIVTYPADGDGKAKTMCVPMDNNNTDYQNILKWVEDGNTIEEAD
jgi:hypothetical protein